MKRKVFLRYLVSSIFVLFIAVILFFPKSFTYHLEDVTMVEFWDGSGRSVEITDQEQVEAAVQMFHKNRFWHFGLIPRPPMGGWSYRFRFFHGDERMTKIYLTHSGRIEVSGLLGNAFGGRVDIDFYREKLF